MSSPNYDHLAHLKIPLESILSATNNFADKNSIGEADFVNHYKGQLVWSGELIKIHAQRWSHKEWDDEKEQQFWMEISLLSSLKHKNLVSLVGFCDENGEKIIINKYENRESLDNSLSDPMLTWVRRLQISVGLANALSYIHYDELRDFSLIHRNIGSGTVLLNDNWEPKLSEFRLSMKVTTSQRHLSFDTGNVSNRVGYTDPTCLETKNVSHESDIYSFGIIMFELLCGRKAVIDDQNNKYLAPVAITHHREEKLENIVEQNLWKQIDPQSFKVFIEIAYNCLNEERSQRPNINEIVTKLEETLELARVNHPIHYSPNHLAHLRIPYENIESATNFFADNNFLSTDGFGKLYKGGLLWSGELIDITARRLIIKEWDDEKEQQFWTEISMLSSLKHKNLVSIVGFCNEVGAETIIYKHVSGERLDNYLSDPVLLTWVKRLEICVSIAHALSYIHYDEPRDFSIIHLNISSETVRLNNVWEPKLSEFQHSLKIKASERHHAFHTDSIWSRKGYTDPTYLETSSVNHKSDVYSFGIVLFELLCGRKAVTDDEDNKYLAPVAIFHYRENILDAIIDPDLWKQLDPQSLNIFAETAYECLNEEQSQRPNMDQIVTRLEKALELQLEYENAEHSIVVDEVEGTLSGHEEVSASHFTSIGVEYNSIKKTMYYLKYISHSQFSFEDIESATNNFAPENIIKIKTNAWVYQGRMLHSGQFIDIVARGVYNEYQKDESKKFRMEKSMLSSLSHKNLVSIIGFCDTNNNMISVYKKEANGSLDKYLSYQTLTWMQRQKICVGLGNALSYINYDAGRDFSVIHCNVRSSKILLDDKWEPKLSGFELALKNTVARRHRLLLTRDIFKNAYLDPKYKNNGGVTHKSDVYSFGVVLFEVLCRRSAIIPDEELEEGLLSQLAKSHLDDMIDEHSRKQMDAESLKIFLETAYWCIQEERADRPYIDQVVERLEKALQLQWRHENRVDRTSFSRHLKGKNLEHLVIGLNDIIEATKNFDDAYCIGSGGFGKVYKADLEHFDSSNSSSREGVDKCNLPRKRSTVAIKRMYNQEGEQGFIAEIEILTSCKHENIINLLGFCYEDNGAMILVYEHASKGSLESYLGNNYKMTNLKWLQRLNICLDIAHGLNYIHNNIDHGKQKMIHRDIKSDNIVLGDNWKAKIVDFGLSKFHPADQAASTFYTNTIAGTYMYLDPEYEKYGKLNKKSDIYSFGVVLLEILTGTLAYDSVYTNLNEKGIANIARDHFGKGTVMEIVDHKIKEETDEHVFSLSKGPNKESLHIFLEIAFRCVAETQAQRPTIEVVINELKKALDSQENHKDNLKLSLEYIKLATRGFSQENIIGHGDSGNVYKGVTHSTHRDNIIAAKRLAKNSGQEDAEVLTELAAAKFMAELDILMEYKHLNVIDLLGYCDEEDEKVIVYEYASRGSLDKYLSDDSLTWVMRLKICIDIATGLEFLHGTVSSPDMVIHRDISSTNILLFNDWKAKITGFGLSLVCPTNQNGDYVIDNVTGTIGYRDPLHSKTGFLTKESDIFSLGAVLFDLLCGKLSSEKLDDEYLYLPFLAKQHCHIGKLDKLVFEGIKEQIVLQSFITFTRIALQCLHHRRERRPTAGEVVVQLKKSLEFQEDYEIWEPKLPKDYKEIIKMSKCPEIYSTIKKEDLYNIFSKGILLQQDKVLMSFDGNGERNEMVSATMFSYINSCPHEWKSLPESRFDAVVEMSDISNLNVNIKTRAQFLSPDVVYGVYLVFKFCDSRNFSSRPAHVNLNYIKGTESRYAYLATWRDKEWMIIELDRYSNKKEDIVFEFLLESFSTYQYGDGAIYVEGIEFRAIEKEFEWSNLYDDAMITKIMSSPKDKFAHLRIPLEIIQSATNNFDEENVKSTSGIGNRYMGQLLWSGELIDIIARRLNKDLEDGEQMFWMEISMLSSLKHKNLVSLVGFSDENGEKIIITRHDTRGSLENYLSDPMLTWVRRLEICVGLAHALSYIHYDEQHDFSIIHRYICSAAVVLNDDWKPKLCDFECSMKIKAWQRHRSFHTNKLQYQDGYGDPTYIETNSVSHKSDIYSIGIILFEVLCGRKSVIDDQDNKNLAPMAIFHYREKKLDDIIDPYLRKQMDPQSLNIFAETSYDCLNKERLQRRNIDEIVLRLEKALELQLENYDNSVAVGRSPFMHKKFQHLKIELEAIKSATSEFNDSHCIGKGGFGKVYKGELVHSKGRSVVALKRLDRAFGQGDPEFWKEIIMLSLYRHDNIVSLLGFCDDCGEKILIYEYASQKSLDLYLNNKDLTWVQRLKICIGAARGLAYLHNPGQTHQRVLHRDIKSSNILLDENWNARIADLGLSKFGPANQQYSFLVSNAVGTLGYCDPLYVETGLLTKESDVYSFGVVLFEMLCGRLCIRYNQDKPLTILARKCYKQKTIDDIVYACIKDEINPHSLKAFTTVAYQCLKREADQRPFMTKVVKVLETALSMQVSNMPPPHSISPAESSAFPNERP